MDPVSSTISGSQLSGMFHVPEVATEKPGLPPYFDSTGFSNGSLVDDVKSVVDATGGATTPMALLAAQTRLIEVEMSWLFSSQVASKVTSGIQTLFNNQV